MTRAFDFLYGRPKTSVQCPGCRRWFNTPQGLGLHFAWLKRGKHCRKLNRLAARAPKAPGGER